MSVTSSPLTSGENQLLRADGEFTMKNAPALILEGAFWGAYTLFAIYAIYSLSSKGIRNSRPRLTLVIVTTALYLLSTTLFALDTYAFLVQIKNINLTIASKGETVIEKASANDLFVFRAFFGSWLLFCFQMLVGDAVVLWRTWVLWHNQLLFMVIPCLFWLASFATFIAFNVVYCTSPDFPFVELLTNAKPGSHPLPGVLQLTNWILSIATNAISSVMIGTKFWQHRHMIIQFSDPSKKARSQSLRVLAVLIQSGLVYLVITGVLTMTLASFEYGPVEIFNDILNKLSNVVVGLYPTIVIVLVEAQKWAWVDEEGTKEISHHHDTLSTLRFASRFGDVGSDTIIDNSERIQTVT